MSRLGSTASPSEFGASPVALDLYLDGYEGPLWKIKPFRYRSGWLAIAEARRTMPFGTWKRILVACVSDFGEVFSSAEAETVFDIPSSLPREVSEYEPECFEMMMDDLQARFTRETDRNNLLFLADLNEQIQAKITAYETRCRKIEGGIADATRLLRAERRRTSLSSNAPSEIDAKLARLSTMNDALAAGMRDRIRAMRAANDDIEADVLAALGKPGLLTRTCTVRWRAISKHGRIAPNVPMRHAEGWREDTFGSRMAFSPLGWDCHRRDAAE